MTKSERDDCIVSVGAGWWVVMNSMIEACDKRSILTTSFRLQDYERPNTTNMARIVVSPQ